MFFSYFSSILFRRKRKVEVVVISEVHLGTYGWHAKQLLTYLNSLNPKTLILNGDSVDIWQFNKWHFPKPHVPLIKKTMPFTVDAVEVIYITGIHDEVLREFSNIKIWNILLSINEV